MSDHHPATVLEDRVDCGERAAYCRCAKDAGHEHVGDLVHACDPTACTGKWTGHFNNARFDGGPEWEPVERPQRVGPWRRPMQVTVSLGGVIQGGQTSG